MRILSITLRGVLFGLGILALVAWGATVGLMGLFAAAPPFRAGGHAPGLRRRPGPAA